MCIRFLACFMVLADAVELSEFPFCCLQSGAMKDNPLALGPLDLQMNETIFQKLYVYD